MTIQHHRPARVPAVIEGEVVKTSPSRQARRKVVHLVTTLRESDERPAVAVRSTAGAIVLTAAGLGSWCKRAYDAGTMGTYRRQIRAAEAVGDREALGEWLDRKERAVEQRHRRVMDLPVMALGVLKGCGFALAALVGLVLLLGIVAQLSGVGSFVGFMAGVLAVISFVAAVITFLWVPLIALLPVFVLIAAYREGKRLGSGPAWAVTTAEDSDIPIDESTIAQALGALNIKQINDYLKSGAALQYITTARRDGRGTHAVIRLPKGVTAEKVATRRADLATGLHRLAKEVWPTTGSEAGVLDLWVADKGALAEGAGPYPLLESGTVDVFKGVPFGRNLRGTPIMAPIMERNTITGGMPGQGKSSAARVIMAGAALDPTVEMWVFVPDVNYDFEAFRPRCSRYVMGAEDEHIAEILDHLRDLHREVQRRGELLVKHKTAAVTRELASRVRGLHPLVVLLEEAHVAIQDATHGAEISKLLVDIVKLGRKRGIHVIVSTQAPTKDSMPRDVTRNCSNGIAFAVGDHVANDALLGQGAYRAGHRATELIPGTDRGTAIVKGFTGQRSEAVQVYFLSADKENDQVTPIIERAMAAIERRGKGVPGAGRPAWRQESRDLLEDLDEVLGDEPVPSADVPALLRDLAPQWPPYKSLTGKALREQLLKHYDVKVPSTGNRWPVDPGAVRAALAARSTAHLDDE